MTCLLDWYLQSDRSVKRKPYLELVPEDGNIFVRCNKQYLYIVYSGGINNDEDEKSRNEMVEIDCFD